MAQSRVSEARPPGQRRSSPHGRVRRVASCVATPVPEARPTLAQAPAPSSRVAQSPRPCSSAHSCLHPASGPGAAGRWEEWAATAPHTGLGLLRTRCRGRTPAASFRPPVPPCPSRGRHGLPHVMEGWAGHAGGAWGPAPGQAARAARAPAPLVRLHGHVSAGVPTSGHPNPEIPVL